jgi:cytochrome c peroxidase
VENHVEMGLEDMDYLEEKLAGLDYYPSLFKQAFGNPEVTKEKIAKSLAQFIRSMTSFDSKMDRQLLQGEAVFTVQEELGMNVFVSSGCNSCHRVVSQGGIFEEGGGYHGTGDDLANIGLDLLYEDKGFAEGKFKIPSLRNIRYTSPYMHDGRFETLEDVIEHYNEGVKDHPSLDFRLQATSSEGQMTPRQLNLSQSEKNALISFIETLEDESILTDEKYSDPFIR